jgi:hypothetical protein
VGVVVFGVLFALWVAGLAVNPRSRQWGVMVSGVIGGLMVLLAVLMLFQVVPPWGFGSYGPGPGPGAPVAPTDPAVPPVKR